jgi:SAM-dependent methyltransferase
MLKGQIGLDGSEADFFRFLGEYRRLILSCIPGSFGFEYDNRYYISRVYRHLEMMLRRLPQGASVLDLGTGRGHFGAYLAQRGLRVKGVDVKDPHFADDLFLQQDPNSISYYPKLWQEASRHFNLELDYYDGVNIPTADASLDAVLFYATFEHVPPQNIKKLLGEVTRVLKPGAQVFIFRCPTSLAWTEHLAAWMGLGHHEKLYAKGEVLRLLKDAGFKVRKFGYSDFFPGFLGRWQKPIDRSFPVVDPIDSLLCHIPGIAAFSHHFVVWATLQGPEAPREKRQ